MEISHLLCHKPRVTRPGETSGGLLSEHFVDQLKFCGRCFPFNHRFFTVPATLFLYGSLFVNLSILVGSFIWKFTKNQRFSGDDSSQRISDESTQNPYGIQVYWLVHTNPYSGLV